MQIITLELISAFDVAEGKCLLLEKNMTPIYTSYEDVFGK